MSEAKSVLVVDDSRVSRLMTRQYIMSEHPDWNVVEAATGEEALALIQAGGLTPVLIMLDVNMPGIGGLAAAEQLLTLCPGVRICLATANVQNATRNRASELGIGFMEKPITEARIHQVLAALEA